MESMLASRDVPGIKLNASVRMEPSPSQPCRGSCEICQACTVQMAEMGHGIASACSVLVTREDRNHLGPKQHHQKNLHVVRGNDQHGKENRLLQVVLSTSGPIEVCWNRSLS